MKDQDPQTVVEEGQNPPLYQNLAALEMSEESFQQWRHHPVTQCFLLFLAHRSLDLKRVGAEFFVSGTLDLAEKQGLRGRIMELEDLCRLKVADIQQFYGKVPEAKKLDSKSKI